jgi:esterase
MILNYQEYGSGRPLIILHGLLGSLDNWHALGKRLGSAFMVLAVDQRNHGRSPHSDVFTYAAMADDVLELLDHRRITSAHVLGHSMGGKTAMQLALSRPDRVDKLVVVDIAPRAYPRLHDEILDALMLIDLPAFDSRQQVDDELSKKIPDFAVRQFLMKNLARTSAGGFIWKANLPAIYANYAGIAQEISSPRPFPNPTLFIKSNRSGYVLDSDAPSIKSLFPRGQITGVDAGHWIHAEAPDLFYDIVLRFLLSEPSS